MKKILVIDDDPNVCVLLSEAIRALDGNPDVVEYAHSGEEGLKKYKKMRPKFVFLDMRMSGMNGMETFERIRRIDRDANVFIVTGYICNELAEAIKLGANGYILKNNGYIAMVASLIIAFDKSCK